MTMMLIIIISILLVLIVSSAVLGFIYFAQANANRDLAVIFGGFAIFPGKGMRGLYPPKESTHYTMEDNFDSVTIKKGFRLDIFKSVEFPAPASNYEGYTERAAHLNTLKPNQSFVGTDEPIEYNLSIGDMVRVVKI